jgi:hypothetical protein
MHPQHTTRQNACQPGDQLALVRRLWDWQSEGKYRFICTRNPKLPKNHPDYWHDIALEDWSMKTLEHLVRRNSHLDLYFCPHGFTHPKRKKEYAVPPRMLYADLDRVHPNDCKLRPTIAAQSSPGKFHAYWLLTEQLGKEEWERLSQQWTYVNGADKGGWDLTQVLRIFGSINYKYEDEHVVTPLWTTGEVYDPADIQKIIPFKNGNGHDASGDAAARAWRRLGGQMSAKLRDALLADADAVPLGKRSDKQYWVEASLAEMGASENEIKALMANCAWQKFDGHKLDGEIDRVKEKKRIPGPARFEVTRGSDFEFKEVVEMWKGRIAIGKLTIICGPPGVGKSPYVNYIQSLISVGGDWPDGTGKAPLGKSLYLLSEEQFNDAAGPRIAAMGGDLSQILVVNSHDTTGSRTFNVMTDIPELDRIADEHPDIKLLVVDAFNSFTGPLDGKDHYSNHVMRAIIHPLTDWCARREIPGIVILHPTKSEQASALAWISGSAAVGEVARGALIMMPQGDYGHGKILRTKYSYSFGKPVPGLLYHVTKARVPVDEFGKPCSRAKAVKFIPTVRIVHDGETQETADDAMKNYFRKTPSEQPDDMATQLAHKIRGKHALTEPKTYTEWQRDSGMKNGSFDRMVKLELKSGRVTKAPDGTYHPTSTGAGVG